MPEPLAVVEPLSLEEKAKASEFLKAHPALLETLLEKMPQIIQEKMSAIIGGETLDALKKAANTVDRSKVGNAIGTIHVVNKPVMVPEQRAEWLRCAVGRLLGQNVAPKSDLDADGLITQALNPITGASGAFLLPDEFIPEIEKKEGEVQTIWPLLQKRQAKSRTVIKPEITAYPSANKGTAANVNSATTATEITETVPTYSEIEWNLEDFDMRFPVKLDLIEESPISVYDELIWNAADAFAIEHEREPITGTGHANKRPLGLLDSGASIATVAISAAPTVDNILDFLSNVPQRYRARATMVFPPTTFFKVAAVFAQNINAPQFLTSIGALPPMKESEYITEGKVLAGDFNRYVVYYIRLLQIIQSIAAERKTREVVVTETWTGKPTIVDAFRIGTGITYT